MNSATRELLEQHFDTAFAAPDGIKKLRELILTLAMQGKLVPQDPGDPPASQLLKEIEAEKSRLWRDGEIKAPKPLTAIKAAEIPYSLPQGWEWVRIRAICYDFGQKTPDSRFTYIDVGSIDSKAGVVGQDVQVLEPHEAPSRARKIVHRGTVIYSTVRPYLLNIAIIEDEYDNEAIASTAFAILHPFTSINNRFVYFYLRSPTFIKYVEGTMKGVAYPAINDGDFFQGVFPLPPISEQHRIVAKIDQLMARCDELEKLRAEREQKRRSVHAAALKQLLDAQAVDSIADAWQFISLHFGDLYAVKENVAELRKAVLQLAVMGKLVPQNPNDPPASQLLKEIEAEKMRLVKEGKIKTPKPMPEIKPGAVPYALPQGWEWVRIPDCYYGIGNKSNQIQTKDYFESGNYPVVDQGKAFIAAYFDEKDKLLVIPKPVVVFGDHTKNIKFIDFDFVIGADGVKILCPYDGVTTKYMYRLMQSYDLTDRGYARHFKVLNDKLVPLPPLPEQHRIVAKIDQIMALCDTLDQKVDAATNKQTELLDALMASA